MTWLLTWLNVNVATLNITLQLLVIYILIYKLKLLFYSSITTNNNLSLNISQENDIITKQLYSFFTNTLRSNSSFHRFLYKAWCVTWITFHFIPNFHSSFFPLFLLPSLSLFHLEEKEKWQALWPFGSLWCFRSLFCYLGPTQEAKPSNPSLSLLSILLRSLLLLSMRISPAWGTISTMKLVHRQSPL